jgi:hypothetical protein
MQARDFTLLCSTSTDHALVNVRIWILMCVLITALLQDKTKHMHDHYHGLVPLSCTLTFTNRAQFARDRAQQLQEVILHDHSQRCLLKWPDDHIFDTSLRIYPS